MALPCFGISVIAQTVADTTNVADTTSIVEDDLGLDNNIDYYGKDSTVVDVDRECILLYGEAWVKYGDMEVKADFIEFSFNDFTARAVGKRDSTGQITQRATFREADKEFAEDSLAYNFKTKRGISYGVRTKEDQIYLLSEVSKKATNNWISIGNGQLTTCDHENPHFHFRLKRALVIPNDKVVSGPVVLKFRKVPLAAFPFGFFPNKRESSQGILLPGYGNSKEKGFFLTNLGYYVPISNKVDAKVTFDIYTRGSWALRNDYNYKNNYRYNGTFNVGYTANKQGLPELKSYTETNSFVVGWTHTQDPRSRPNTTFNSNVRISSLNNFQQNINVNQQDFLSNTFTSTINYGKRWPNKPYNIGVVASQTQNNVSRNVDVTLPQLTANLTRISLGRFFPEKPRLKAFLNNFGFDASMNAANKVSAKNTSYRWDRADSLWMRSRNGIKTSGQMSAALKAKQYATVNFSLRAESFHAVRALQQFYNPDILQYQKDTINKFISALNWGASMSASHRVYGTFNMGNGRKIKALRHTMQWSEGMSYTPYNSYSTNYFQADGTVANYTAFDLASFQPQSTSENLNANFSLQQNIEAKVRDKTSAKLTYKKVKLLESWNTRISRNFLADSLKWSKVTMTAFTKIGSNTTINYNNSFSLYDRDSLGREINQYMWSTQRKLMRLIGNSISLNFDLKSKNKTAAPKATDTLTPAEQEVLVRNKDNLIDFSTPWTLSVSYVLGYTKGFSKIEQADTIKMNHTIGFRGDITFLKRYAISVNSGYNLSNARYQTPQFKDFGLRDFSSTTISLHVDLHCWEFSCSYIPFGTRQSWMAQLNIKSPLLKDLKLQRRGTFGENNGNLW